MTRAVLATRCQVRRVVALSWVTAVSFLRLGAAGGPVDAVGEDGV